jgi:pSer/pThr/pTyr-binding forkhead associated (FHA) protein
VVRLNFEINNPALEGSGIFIGRDSKSCDLSINDGSISRKHARIFKRNEDLWIEDLDSTNGCFLNGKRVAKGSASELPTRGILTLGEVELSINES